MGGVDGEPKGFPEPTMKHHPSMFPPLTPLEDSGWWAVWLGRHAAEKVSAAPKGQLTRFRTPGWSATAKAGLTGPRKIRGAVPKGWRRDPRCPFVEGSRRQKSYPGNNRLVAPESLHRRRGLVPRCRLSLSWLYTSSQGCRCPLIKRDRELGLERSDTVQMLTTGSAGGLSGSSP